ncbi:hypothetical protein ACLGL2_07500 [Parvimonas sp. G1641]|uniref:hypothetical protein n=1 Tax=Parvimonas sp. G1641 TaxID=3388846 RepID=UPI00397FC285
MIEQLFNEIELALQNKISMSVDDFALYVQDYLCDNYDEMYKENAEVTEFLNEDLPEITDIAEYGDDKRNEEFKRRLRIEIDKAKELFYK